MKNFYKKIRYRLEFCLFLLFKSFLIIIGFERATRFCAFIARNIGPLLKITQVARNNIDATLKLQNREEIIIKMWDHYGRYIAEFVFLDRFNKEEIKSRVKFEGLEHLKQYQTAGRPFLICLAHIGNWDFCIKSLDTIYPDCSIVYRKVNNPFIDAEILKIRSSNLSSNVEMIEKHGGGVRSLVKAIKSKHTILMLVDQKMNDGIAVPFLGKTAMTTNSIARISCQYNYPIVPIRILRTKDSNFKVTIYEAIEYTKTNDTDADCLLIMTKINEIIGQWVKQCPEQWFWFHNRWKK